MRIRLSFDSNRDAHNRKYTYQSIVYCWRSDITLVGIETQNFFYLSTGRYHLRSAQHFEGASGSFCFALSLQQPDMQHPPAASLALKNDTNLHLISLGMVEFLKSKDVLIPINSQETSTAVFFFFFSIFYATRFRLHDIFELRKYIYSLLREVLSVDSCIRVEKIYDGSSRKFNDSLWNYYRVPIWPPSPSLNAYNVYRLALPLWSQLFLKGFLRKKTRLVFLATA